MIIYLKLVSGVNGFTLLVHWKSETLYFVWAGFLSLEEIDEADYHLALPTVENGITERKQAQEDDDVTNETVDEIIEGEGEEEDGEEMEDEDDSESRKIREKKTKKNKEKKKEKKKKKQKKIKEAEKDQDTSDG